MSIVRRIAAPRRNLGGKGMQIKIGLCPMTRPISRISNLSGRIRGIRTKDPKARRLPRSQPKIRTRTSLWSTSRLKINIIEKLTRPPRKVWIGWKGLWRRKSSEEVQKRTGFSTK